MQKSSQTSVKTTDNTLGSLSSNNLKNLRKEKKLTLEKLAELSSLSPSYLSRLEVGTRRFNMDILQKLSHILECHPSDLIESNIKYSESVKDLPIYGARPNAETIDFGSPLEHGKRPHALSGIKTAFGIYIRDAAYAPKYMPGDIIYIHPDRPLAQGCPALAISKDDKIIIGQFEEWVKSNLLLRDFSGMRDFFTIPHSTLRVVYRVIGSIESA
jgi:transcriptional regulator with XRE-family HTH domain